MVKYKSRFADDVYVGGGQVSKPSVLAVRGKYALLIVDAGRREMARKLHPDQGGTHDQMSQLNLAVDWLKELIKESI
jgi:hypothetical protein